MLDHPPFSIRPSLDPFVADLKEWLQREKNLDALDQAVKNAYKQNIKQLNDWNIVDGEAFLAFASSMLKWTPSENVGGKEIYSILCLLYFVFDQDPINKLQTAIDTSSIGQPLTYLSDWVVQYSQEVGKFMNSPESLTPLSYQSFIDSPRFNLDEAEVPAGGFQNFNQLFARKLKKGSRPISSPDDDKVIVCPADATFNGKWDIGINGTVPINTYPIQTANVKLVDWPISALLQGCDYAAKFNGGQWIHASLGPADYHRQHAPVSGTVVDARVVPGLAHLNVQITQDEDGNNILRPKRSPESNASAQSDAPDHFGYQFLQTRGVITIDNPTLGYVVVLPIGMAQISSVVINPDVQVGKHITKGDEISHFEFGGSDFVMVLEPKADVKISSNADNPTGQGQKYQVNEALGYVDV